MKFLSKNNDSKIKNLNLIYKEHDAAGNSELLEYLMEEQKYFCAYTETYFKSLDSVHVEHFNSSIKYKDDYFNYYAVLATANNYKKDEEYKDADFFKSLFFQDKKDFEKRIIYRDGFYLEINEDDIEAMDFIDFIGLNHPKIDSDRSKHIKRLKEIFEAAQYDNAKIQNYFSTYPQELSFITAIEYHFNIDLSSLYL